MEWYLTYAQESKIKMPFKKKPPNPLIANQHKLQKPPRIDLDHPNTSLAPITYSISYNIILQSTDLRSLSPFKKRATDIVESADHGVALSINV